jgi:DNA-binding NarL/FixJ family response regulator
MTKDITIIIADDHPVFRSGLRQIIETDAKLKVVAEAGNGADALEMIRQLTPMVAVLDVNMPQKDGFEVAQQVRAEKIPTEMIFLTMFAEEKFFNAAMDLGIKGYILKDSAIADILSCIHKVAQGQNFITPTLSTYLVNRARSISSLVQQEPGLQSLTAAERQVLKFIAKGKTSKQIADALCVSVRTIEHHRSSIAGKLNLKGGNALLQFAIKHQLEL